MDAELWDRCEMFAKAGRIELIVHLLRDEIASRLVRTPDPSVDITLLIVSCYDPAGDYSLKGFVAVLVSALNSPGFKAKQPQ